MRNIENNKVSRNLLYLYFILLFSPMTELFSFLPSFKLEQLLCFIIFIVITVRCGFHITINNKKVAGAYFIWVLYVFLIVMISGIRYQTMSLRDAYEILKPLLYIIQFYVLINYLFYKHRKDDLIRLLCIVIFLQGVLGILQVMFPSTIGQYSALMISEKYTEIYTVVGHVKRSMGTVGNPNILGFIIAIGILLGSFKLFNVNELKKGLIQTCLFIAISFVAVYFTGSRTAFIISIIYFILVYFFVYKGKSGRKLIVGTALIAISIFGFNYLKNTLDARVLFVSGGLNSRLEIWSYYYPVIENNMFFGAGINKGIEYLDATVDNEHLKILLHYGMIGYFLFFFPFLANVKLLVIDSYQKLYNIFLLGVALFMVTAVAYDSYTIASYVITMFAIIYKGTPPFGDNKVF